MNQRNKIYFPDQQDDEVVSMVLREHWVVLFMKLAAWSVSLVVLFALHYADMTYFPSVLNPELLPLVDIVKICILLLLTLSLFIILTLYYLNVYVVTNERVVNISQKSLLTHTVSKLHLDQIQDVTAEIHGLPENIFDFGDVYIQTAGETERFLFHNVPSPSKVTKTILELYEELQKKQNGFQDGKTT